MEIKGNESLVSAAEDLEKQENVQDVEVRDSHGTKAQLYFEKDGEKYMLEANYSQGSAYTIKGDASEITSLLREYGIELTPNIQDSTEKERAL